MPSLQLQVLSNLKQSAGLKRDQPWWETTKKPLRILDGNTFWPLIQLSLNLTCSSLYDLQTIRGSQLQETLESAFSCVWVKG